MIPHEILPPLLCQMQHLTAPPFLYAGAYGFWGHGIACDSADTCMASGSDSALGPFSPHDPVSLGSCNRMAKGPERFRMRAFESFHGFHMYMHYGRVSAIPT